MNKWHHEDEIINSIPKYERKKPIQSVQQRGEVLIKKIQVKLFRVNYMCIHSATHGCHVKVTCQFDTHGCHVTITCVNVTLNSYTFVYCFTLTITTKS